MLLIRIATGKEADVKLSLWSRVHTQTPLPMAIVCESCFLVQTWSVALQQQDQPGLT